MRTSVVWLAVLICPGLDAQQNPKIGVINLQQAMATTKEGQKATQDMSSKIAPRQKEFDSRQKELADLENQLSRGSVLSDEKKAELARDVETKKKRLERDIQDADESLRNDQQGLVQAMSQKLMSVITKYAKDNNYTCVLEAGDQNTQVVYAMPEIDITTAIVSAYDKTYAAGQSQPPPTIRP